MHGHMGCPQFGCFLFSARFHDNFQHGSFNSVIKEHTVANGSSVAGSWERLLELFGAATPKLFLSLSGPQTNGTLLATGSYDGFARIWTEDGEFCVPRAEVG